MSNRVIVAVSLMSALILVHGCGGGIPKEALQMNKATLEDRQMQTRIFDTADQKKIIVACSGLMQDLGLNMDESEIELGLLVGSKDRDATDGGQVATAVILAAMFGGPCQYDKNQKMKASIVTSPAGEAGTKTSVRVTFQRSVWNNYGQVTKLEKLNEPEMYQGFFDKLSKAVFLEAQSI